MKPEAEEREITREEVRKEFQLERMILFSDAVFAIVITLMAIEIRLPGHGAHENDTQLLEDLKHLLPVIIAYAVSFCFIGMMWYKHLQLFSLLKDYNRNLVVCNMVFLFCIGLFPFSASLVGGNTSGIQTPLFVYMGIIALCKTAQHVLNEYIIRHPELRLNTNLDDEVRKLKKGRFITIMLLAMFVLVGITNIMIADPGQKPLAMMWMLIFPFAQRIYKKINPAVEAQ